MRRTQIGSLVIAGIIIVGTAIVHYPQDFVTKTGIGISARLTLDKSTIMIGEAMYMSFEVTNHSGFDFFTPVGGDYRNNLGRPDSYSVQVVRNDGYKPFHPKVGLGMGGLLGTQKVPANGSWIKRLYLPHWVEFEQPGRYQITVSKSVPIRIDDELVFDKRLDGSTESFMAVAKAEIDVIPNNYERLGELVNEWGRKMMDMSDPSTHESTDLLAYTKDTRTIIFFAEALERFSRRGANYDERSRVRQIAHALSKFNNDFAIFALRRAMSNTDDDIRLWVADAFSTNEHPKSLESLLQMKDDPYWFVRLRVVQKLDKIVTEESNELLWQFARDQHESVREQAEDILKKRGILGQITKP